MNADTSGIISYGAKKHDLATAARAPDKPIEFSPAFRTGAAQRAFGKPRQGAKEDAAAQQNGTKC